MNSLVILIVLVVKIKAEVVIDIRLQDVQVTHQNCTNTSCVLTCEASLPPLSNKTYTITYTAPKDPNLVVRFGDIFLNGQKNMLKFTISLNDEPKYMVNPPKLGLRCRLSLHGVRFRQSKMETPVHHLLSFSKSVHSAPFYQIRLVGSGLTLNILIRAYCAEGFFGKVCNKKCLIPVGFYNDTVWCDGDKLYCRKGWTGINCQLRDPCTLPGLQICQNEAKCVPTYTPGLGYMATSTFRCICKPGWTGNLCSQPVLYACHYPNGTIGYFNEWGYAWKDDKLDQAIRIQTNTTGPSEVYLTWTYPTNSSMPDNAGSMKAEIFGSQTSSQSMLGNMWRLGMNQSNVPQRYIMWRALPSDPSSDDRSPTLSHMWRLMTNMEPMSPVPLNARRFFPCPIYPTIQMIPAFIQKPNYPVPLTVPECKSNDSTFTSHQLSRCSGYNWTTHCYEVPCLLLQGHLTDPPHTELYVPWRATLSQSFPHMINIKPVITFTPLVLRNGVNVTSANLHATQNGVPLSDTQRILAFTKLPLSQWACCVPVPICWTC